MLNIIQLCICTSVLEMWGLLCAFNESIKLPVRDSSFMPDPLMGLLLVRETNMKYE